MQLKAHNKKYRLPLKSKVNKKLMKLKWRRKKLIQSQPKITKKTKIKREVSQWTLLLFWLRRNLPNNRNLNNNRDKKSDYISSSKRGLNKKNSKRRENRTRRKSDWKSYKNKRFKKRKEKDFIWAKSRNRNLKGRDSSSRPKRISSKTLCKKLRQKENLLKRPKTKSEPKKISNKS